MTKKPPIRQREVLTLDDIENAGIRFTGDVEPEQAPDAAPEQSGVARRVLGDTGISLLKGAIGVPEAAVGLADLVSGGHAGKLAEDMGFRPKEARQILDDYYSPEQKAANQAVKDAKGFVDTAVTAVQNPSTIVHAAVESAPSLLGAGGIARGALKVAPKLSGAVAAGIGEGAVSAGQTAEQVRQETPDGLLTGGQAGIAAASGTLTALLTGVAGKVANRLGIGDVNQLVAGAQKAAPAAQKGLARSIAEGFATEGILQELPQSAQEQIAQNVALGKPWDEGVGAAAAMGALAGGLMGGAAGPLHGKAEAPAVSPGDQLRETKLPGDGVFAKSLNAGIETAAQAADRVKTAPAAPAAAIDTGVLGLAAEPTAADPNSIDFEPTAHIDTGGLAIGDANAIAAENLAKLPAFPLEKAQAIKAQGAEQGMSMEVVPHPAGGYTLAPRRWVTQQMIDAVQQPAAAVLPSTEGMTLEGETSPAAAPLALPYDRTPTGVLIADETGAVRPETRAEVVNRGQDHQRQADLGLTPDVVRASMRTAMGTETRQGDLTAAGGLPFRNRRAAQAAAARAGQGHQVVEIAPDSFVGRMPAPQEAQGTHATQVDSVPEQAAPAAAAPAAPGEIWASDGGPWKSERAATRAAKLKPGYAVEPVDGGWVLRQQAGTVAGEAIDGDWHGFAPESGSLNIPRAEMPQIKAEHRGAMTNFLNARGIEHEQVEIPAGELKPSQAEFSPAKVAAAKQFTGGDRSILVSSDGHVLDGHHQWLAKLDAGEPVKAIRLNAPMQDLLPVVREFPSAEQAAGATEVKADSEVERPVLSRGAKAPGKLQGRVEVDENGNPTFENDKVFVGFATPEQRIEVIPVEGQQVLRYTIAPATGFGVLGHVDLLMENGKPTSLLDIEVYRGGRKAGTARAAVEAILAGTDGDLNISNIVSEARGFWDKLGVPEQNLPDGHAYEGTLNADTYRRRPGHDPARVRGDAGQAAGGSRREAAQADGRTDAGAEGSARAASGDGEATGRDGGKDGEGSLASRGAGPAGVKADDLKKSFAGMIAGWKNGPSAVTIVQSVADLPANISERLRDLNAEGIVRALFLPKSKAVYLVADNVGSVEEAQFALLHEVYGHLGLRSVLGERYGDAMVEARRANAQLAAEADEWLRLNGEDEISERVGRGMPRQQAQREVSLLAVEEALADRAGRNEPISGWKRFVATLQRAMRAAGLDKVADWMEGKTQAEVMSLLHQAREQVKGRATADAIDGTPAAAMSRGDQPVLSRSPSEAVRQMTPEIVKDMLAGRDFKRVGWWHKTLGTMYDLAQKHAGFKKVFDEAQNYIQDTSFFANDAADAAPRVLPQLNSFGDFTKALTLPEKDRKAIAAPVFEGTLNWTRDADGKLVETEDVEAAGVVFSPEELRERFKLDDRQIDLYREFRAAVDRSLDSTASGDLIRYLGEHAPVAAKDLAREGDYAALRRVVLDHIETLPAGKLRDEIRAEVNDKLERLDSLKARGYAPLMRFGQFAVRVVGPDGESKFFGLYESGTDAARAARQLAAEFPGDNITRGMMSQEEFKLLKGLSPETMGLFARITGTDQNEAMQLWLKQATSNRSAMKRMIKRKGIEGFSDDVTRVLSSFITSNARAASQALHFGQIQNDVDSIDDGDAKDAAQRLREYVQNPTEEAAALRGFLFANFLGGSLASAAVNMTQPFLMTMPYLSKFVGIAQSGKIVASSIKTVLDYVNGRLTGDLKVALLDAEKRGLVAPQELHQLQAMSMGRGSLLGRAARLAGASENVAGKLDTAGKRAMFIWGAPFALAEQFNRRLTFIAAYQAAKAKGMPDPTAFAAQAVVETQGLYNKANRPEWARGAVGATVLTFKQYSIGYLEFMKRLWTAGEPGSAERAEGRKAALFGIALLIMAAGAQGLPGADDLDDLIDTIGQKLGYDTNAKRWKRDRIPQWLQYGFSALPGVPLDVAGRLGLGNLLPGTGLLRKDKTDKSGEVWEMVGAAGGAAQGIIKAADSGSVVPLLPTAIGNAVKGIDIARTGAYRDTKGRKVIDAGLGDAVTKAIGFQPAEVAAASRADGLRISQNTLAKNVESEIAADWASARFESDAAGEEAARARLRKWNADNPDTPIKITMQQIVKRVRDMRATRAERITKATPKELRAVGG